MADGRRPRLPAVTPVGLAAQRTTLAWSRTVVGLLTVALLTLRALLIRWTGPPSAGAIVLVAVALAGTLVIAAHRNRVLRRARPAPLRQVRARALSAGVLVFALAGAAASLR